MKIMMIGLLLSLSTAAFAQTGPTSSNAKTTDMYAPKMGVSEFTAGLVIPTGSIENSAAKVEYSGYGLTVHYGYGFSEYATAYVTQQYSSIDIKQTGAATTTTKGLANTIVGLKGIVEYAPAFLFYDVNYQRSIFAKDKSDLTNNENTAASARPSLNLNIGAGTAVNSFGFGALLGYSFYQEGETETVTNAGSTTAKNKAANGSSWKIYAQYEPSWKLGAAYAMTTTESFDRVNGATTTSQAKSELKAISVYGIIPATPESEVFVEITKYEPKDTTGSDYKIYYASATYRLTF